MARLISLIIFDWFSMTEGREDFLCSKVFIDESGATVNLFGEDASSSFSCISSRTSSSGPDYDMFDL